MLDSGRSPQQQSFSWHNYMVMPWYYNRKTGSGQQLFSRYGKKIRIFNPEWPGKRRTEPDEGEGEQGVEIGDWRVRSGDIPRVGATLAVARLPQQKFCHPERNEVESKDLRTNFTGKILRLARLPQDDILFYIYRTSGASGGGAPYTVFYSVPNPAGASPRPAGKVEICGALDGKNPPDGCPGDGGRDQTLLGAGTGSSSFLMRASAIRCLGHTVAHRPQELHLL